MFYLPIHEDKTYILATIVFDHDLVYLYIYDVYIFQHMILYILCGQNI